ncbi:MAG: hypothetical protein ACFCUR_08885 [Rhodomicrobiaceae bacterium]
MERVIASLTVAWVMILTTYMIFQNHELSPSSIYFLKIILSLSGGVMLATLPGFFDINYTIGGFSVRAAGGAAAFVFIYTQSPNLPALKAEERQAPPSIQQERRDSGKTDQLSYNGGVPLFIAANITPGNFATAEAPAIHNETTIFANAAPGLPGAQRISIGQAVVADLAALASTVASYIRSAASHIKWLLDQAATALRSTVDRVFSTLGNLLGLGAASDEGAPRLISVVTEDLLDPLDDLMTSLSGPVTGTIGGILVSVNELGSSLIGGLTHTVDGLVGVTDRTVGNLLTGVQYTTDTLLGATEGLVGGVTGLLNNTTGGLTSGLTAPVENLAGGITGQVRDLSNTAIPAVASTTSGVLTSVNAGVAKVTESLNAVTPGIISKLNPELVDIPNADGNALLAGAIGNLDELPGSLTHALGGATGVLGQEFGERESRFGAANANTVGGLLGGLSRLGPDGGAECISGCDGHGRGLVGGLVAPTLRGGLGGNGGGGFLVGLTSGGGANLGASGGPAGGLVGGLVGGASAGGDQTGGPQQNGGLISSTVRTTGSIVGGTLKSLKRK